MTQSDDFIHEVKKRDPVGIGDKKGEDKKLEETGEGGISAFSSPMTDQFLIRGCGSRGNSGHSAPWEKQAPNQRLLFALC